MDLPHPVSLLPNTVKNTENLIPWWEVYLARQFKSGFGITPISCQLQYY